MCPKVTVAPGVGKRRQVRVRDLTSGDRQKSNQTGIEYCTRVRPSETWTNTMDHRPHRMGLSPGRGWGHLTRPARRLSCT
jgi:hypothetical protein